MKHTLENARSVAQKMPKRKLNILVHADTYTVSGNWRAEPDEAFSRSVADLNGLTLTFDYLVDLNGRNNLVHPDDLQLIKDLIGNLSQGDEVKTQFRIVTPSGHVQLIHCQGSLVEINGRPIADWDENTSDDELELKIFQHAELVSDSGTWTWNLDNDDFFCSDNTCRIFGFEPDTLKDPFHHFSETIHPDDKDRIIDLFTSAKKERKDLDVDFKIITGKSEIRYLKNKAEVFTTRKGVQYFIGTVHDITTEESAKQKLYEKEEHSRAERVEAAQKLTAHEALLKEAEYIGRIGSYEVHLPDFKFHFSDNMYRLLGYKPGAFIPSLDFIDSISIREDADKVRKILEQAIEQRAQYTYRRRIKLPNGDVRYIESEGKVVTDPQGNPSRLVGIARDITRDIAYETTLKEKEESEKIAVKQIVELKEQLAQQATDRYNELFNSIDQGFCTIEVKFDEHDNAVDYQFIEVSPSFEDQTGIKDAAGKWMKDIAPDQDAIWFETYGRIAKNRKAERFEYASTPLRRWWRVYAFPIDDPKYKRIGVLFDDITAEKILENRRSYFLQLNDAIRPLTEPEEIKRIATSILGQRLSVDRALFAEFLSTDGGNYWLVENVYHREGFPLANGLYPVKSFGEELRRAQDSKPIIISDISSWEGISAEAHETFQAASIAAYLAVPLIKDGRLVGLLALHQATPRKWSEEDILLLQETAERMWSPLERAKAERTLRHAEAQYLLELERQVNARTSELESEHKRLKEAQAIGRVGSFEWLLEDNKIIWSDELYRILGLEPQSEVITLESIINFIHPDDRSIFHRKLGDIQSGPKTEAAVFRLQPAKQLMKYTHWRFESFSNTNGSVTRISGTIQDITENRIADEQLRKNLKILQQAEQVAEMGSWEYDIISGQFNWSEGMYSIFGMPSGTSVQPEIYMEKVKAEDYPLVEKIISALKINHKPFVETIRIIAEGKQKIIKVKGTVYNNEEGKPVKMLGVDVDITALAESELAAKEAESLLREKNALLQKIFDASPVGISVVKPVKDSSQRLIDLEVLFANEQMKRQSDTDELVGKMYSILSHPILTTTQLDKINAVIETGNSDTFETQQESQYGIQRFKVIASKVNDDILIISEDITKRKSTEQNLHHQAILIRRVIEASPDVIQLVNVSSGKVAYINKMLLEELNYPFSEIKRLEAGDGFKSLIHADDLEKYNVFHQSVSNATDDDLLEAEIRIKAKNGSWQWYKLRGKIFERDTNGAAQKYIAFSQNITKEKLAEEERKNNLMLMEMDRAKTAFFSNVSHEFRTPLTLLLGPLEDVMKNGGSSLTKQAQDRLQMAYRNALRLQKLVNTLLDYARVESGRVEAVYQPTDLPQFTKDIAATFRSAIENAGLKYVVKCEDPQEPIYVNRDMYEKILLNLLSNAFKFTLQGKIEVVLRANLHHIQLHVRDTGIGISKDNQSKIFERFTRVEGSKARTFEGSGIGLALVKELVTMHGGSIKVKSEEGKGTTFIVIIPKGKAHLSAKQIHEASEKITQPALSPAYVQEALGWLSPESIVDTRNHSKVLSRLQKKMDSAKPKILLADDNLDMREYMQSLLQTEFEVFPAENGQAALKLLDNHLRPDLILADVMMPEVDGYALIEHVRKNRAFDTIPIILLSARAGDEAKIEGMRFGADDYLVKPFSSSELIARINARIQIAKLRYESERRLSETNTELEQKINERTQELQQTKTIIEKQNDLLQKILDGIPQLIWVCNHDEYIRLLNDSWHNYTSVGLEHMRTTDDLHHVLHPGQAKEIIAGMKKCMNEKKTYKGEALVRRKDGHFRWHLHIVAPVSDPNGDIYMWVGSLTDVHEQFSGEIRLKESKDLLEAIFNSTTHGIAVLTALFDEDRNIVDFEWKVCNEILEKLARDKVQPGTRLTENFPGAVSSGLIEKLRDVVVTGEPNRFELFYNHEAFNNWYETSAVKLEDGLVITLQDITDRKNSERKLQHANDVLQHKNHELKVMNDELSTFTFVASHDLREPLRKVQIFSQLLLDQEGTRISDPGKQFLNRIALGVQRMNALIDDILTYSRSGVNPNEMNEASLDEILSMVKSDLSEAIREKNAVIESDPLPLMKCNPLQMGQLFQNLISNALKFQPTGQTPSIRITASIVNGKEINHPAAYARKKYLRLQVADNGIGFRDEYKERIFQMFQRLHGRSEYNGTGMGLAICKKVVESHNGFIAAKGNEGEGAMFCCYFPAELVSQEQQQNGG